MNIALFGGTFDPIHSGHLRAAKAAAAKFRLDRVLFVPSGNPPHKQEDRLTPFAHRFAMVALACKGDPRLIPSLIEAPNAKGRPQYSIDTVRTVRKGLGPDDHLYFLLGLDAFLDLPHWKQYRRLFELVNFIVVSRPGFRSGDILKRVRGSAADGAGFTISVLPGVRVAVSSRGIRESIRNGRGAAGLVPRLVEEYIVKEGLYRPARAGRAKQ